MPSNQLILCLPLILLPSVFPSISIFSNELTLCIRWPKYWPSNEYSQLISFRIDWFDLLAVQGTLKSLLQHHSLKALVLQHSSFFIVQLSHMYMTTGKTIALTIHTFVGEVMSLLSNTLSRFFIAFLPKSKLQSQSTVILQPKKIKSITVYIVSPSIMKWWDQMTFWMLSFKAAFSLSSFTFIKRLFSSSLLSAIRVLSSAYLRFLIFLPATLISAYDSSSPTFPMMYRS